MLSWARYTHAAWTAQQGAGFISSHFMARKWEGWPVPQGCGPQVLSAEPLHYCILAQWEVKLWNCGEGKTERQVETKLLIPWDICPSSINLTSPEILRLFFFFTARTDDVSLPSTGEVNFFEQRF